MTKIIATPSTPIAPVAYRSGGAASPLSGQTIGAYFATIVARQPDVEALISLHQGIRWTYA